VNNGFCIEVNDPETIIGDKCGATNSIPVWKSCRVERAHVTHFLQIYITIK
jgi:hypothetical protein